MNLRAFCGENLVTLLPKFEVAESVVGRRVGCDLDKEVHVTRPPSSRAKHPLTLATLIRTSIYDEHSGSMRFTAHLDHISHDKSLSGTHWSNRWTYRVFIIDTRRD